MKNQSIHLILFILLIVVVPTIQKIVLDTQHKKTITIPLSDTEELSFEKEIEAYDNLELYSNPELNRYFTSLLSSPFQTSFHSFNCLQASSCPLQKSNHLRKFIIMPLLNMVIKSWAYFQVRCSLLFKTDVFWFYSSTKLAALYSQKITLAILSLKEECTLH